MHKRILITAATLCGLAVALGAFGAHALKPILELNHSTGTYETAVKYHMFHALAILGIGIIMAHKPHQLLKSVSHLLLAGTVFFSGSLYIYSINKIPFLPIVTPLGGVLFLCGWILLIYHFIKNY